MFRNTCRGTPLNILCAGAKINTLWDTHIQDGYIKTFIDQELKTMVMELRGNNISTTYMTCPRGKEILGVPMPFLIMIVKNLHKYFSFEVTIIDTTGSKRRFRASNFQSQTQINTWSTAMPIGLSDGWNQIQLNLADFTERAYQKTFAEVISVKINANIRLKRIYFSSRLYTDEELPKEYRLFQPIRRNLRNSKVGDENRKLENVISVKEEGKENEAMKVSLTRPSLSGLDERENLVPPSTEKSHIQLVIQENLSERVEPVESLTEPKIKERSESGEMPEVPKPENVISGEETQKAESKEVEQTDKSQSGKEPRSVNFSQNEEPQNEQNLQTGELHENEEEPQTEASHQTEEESQTVKLTQSQEQHEIEEQYEIKIHELSKDKSQEKIGDT